MDPILLLALFSLLVYVWILVESLIGATKIEQLKNIVPAKSHDCPSISIIVPARNEEATIGEGLTSILQLDYPNLEIIVVNDRSEDRTGAILDGMDREDPRLNIHHLKELPIGWLGKNHALRYGSERSCGELLLFTDADVVMHPKSLREAVHYFQDKKLDHLAIFFEAVVKGGLLNMMIVDFACAFLAGMKPWKARKAGGKYHIGVGAFNLVRDETYRRCGTHRAIAMEPVDDVELGRLIKENGGRQDCLFGNDRISVKWYESVKQMVSGLEKNVFPFCNYSPVRIFAAASCIILLRIWPIIAIFITHGSALVLNGILVLLQFGAASVVAANSSILFRNLLWLPVSPFVGIYILWNSTIRTILRGGIVWRGTFYSLDKLRKKS